MFKRKLKNKKGFTIVEIIFAFGCLTMSMTTTLHTLTTIATITSNNRVAYLELIDYSSEFDDFIKDINVVEDAPPGARTISLDSSTFKSYTTYDVVTTNNVPIDPTTLEFPTLATSMPAFYYKQGLVAGSDDNSYKLHNQTSSSMSSVDNVQVKIHTIRKEFAPIHTDPYYFVVSIFNEIGDVRYY